MKSILQVASALVAGAYLSTGGATFAQTSNWDKIVADAKKEGTVTFYSGSVGSLDNVAVTDAFTAKYGIKVRRLEARAPELRERLRTELSMGQPSADVVYVSTTQLENAKTKGELIPFGEVPRQDKLLPQFKTDGTILPVAVISYGLVVNTSLVPEAAAPKSWKDLLDPKWKGKVLMDDPRKAGAGSTFFTVSQKEFGTAFVKGLADNGVTLTRDNHQAGERVARGEYAMFFPISLADGLKMKGLPVKTYFPKEGGTYVTFGLAIAKNAAHPNAARLLMNHFLESASAQSYFANGRAVTFEADTSGLAPDVAALVKANLWGTQDESSETIDAAKAVFDR